MLGTEYSGLRCRYHACWCTGCWSHKCIRKHGPLARYVKLRLRMRRECRERFPSPHRISNLDMYHGTCVTHVPWCMPGSLTSGFLGSQWRGKRSRHSRRICNPHFYVSGKRPMVLTVQNTIYIVFSQSISSTWVKPNLRYDLKCACIFYNL